MKKFKVSVVRCVLLLRYDIESPARKNLENLPNEENVLFFTCQRTRITELVTDWPGPSLRDPFSPKLGQSLLLFSPPDEAFTNTTKKVCMSLHDGKQSNNTENQCILITQFTN